MYIYIENERKKATVYEGRITSAGDEANGIDSDRRLIVQSNECPDTITLLSTAQLAFTSDILLTYQHHI